MTSEKQIAANRRNAAKSTGPKTPQGKATASRNALRHGLSRPTNDPLAELAAEEFARLLVPEDAPQHEVAVAMTVARAQLELYRVRHQRGLILDDVLGQALPSPAAIKRLANIERYERRAEGRRKRTFAMLSRLCRLPVVG